MASRPRAAVARLPLPRSGFRIGFEALLPTGRSLVVAFSLVAVLAGAYVLARETPMFALRKVEVAGAGPALAAQIRSQLAPLEGRSLVSLHVSEVERRLQALPQLAGVSADRAFPHTLRVVVRREPAVAVVRAGTERWLVTGRGRVLRALPDSGSSPLPRVWLPRTTELAVGSVLTDDGLRAVEALAAARRIPLPARVTFARATAAELTLVLATGPEVLLGNTRNLLLKLAVARRILPRVAETLAAGGYLDVSVPERPVASVNSQFSG